MSAVKTGRSHRAKKELFQKGLRRGFLTVQEIESALPPEALTAAERWLLYYSLRAAEIELRGEAGAPETLSERRGLSLEREAPGTRAQAPGREADEVDDALTGLGEARAHQS